MGKKRKAPSGGATAAQGPNMDVGDSRKRIRDFEDVADSDDEFHINRDKVLLEDEAPEAKRRRKGQEREEFLGEGDEEVLGVSDGSQDEDEEEEEEGWGVSKGEIYGADDIETEEQALEEEAEALRLQKKQLQGMSAADYGFDEAEWQDGGYKGAVEDENVVKDVLPQLQVAEDLGPAERVKILKSRYPEFEPLSRELLALREVHAELLEDAQGGDSPNAVTKLRAASAYLGALTMYFALLSSPASEGGKGTVALSAARLRDHPVMDTLVQCRELWTQAKALPDDPEPADSDLDDMSDTAGVTAENGAQPSTKTHPVQQPKKSRAQKHADAAQAANAARRAERMQRTEADLAGLDALMASSKKSAKAKQERAGKNGVASDMGEETSLTAHEAAEKAKRKKSLRFYTSQIAQKANKRGNASRNAGGDDDIPYRERLRDRQARLNAEAEKRGQRRSQDAGADLGGESDDDDARQARDVRAGGEDDYYDLVAARTAKKKSDRAARAAAERSAAEQGGQVMPEETVGEDGKRRITYAIEKNKGLTPHRKKEVRNPRVKKRRKFDEKKKKLGSIKPVYKGGEGRGGYGGELTGIKKGVVKSTKL